MTREELIANLWKFAPVLSARPSVNIELMADFILTHFTEKPKPSAQERLQNLTNANIPDVWRELSRVEFLEMFSKNLLKFGVKELLDICEQHSRERLDEAIRTNGRGFGV